MVRPPAAPGAFSAGPNVMMGGGVMYPMVAPSESAQARPGMMMMPGVGSFGPSIVGSTPIPGASTDPKLPAPAVPLTQPRPTPRPGGARRGRPPRNAQRNPGQVVYGGTQPVPPPESKQFMPSLSLPQQQALLARAMQLAKQYDSTLSPTHALIQMGYIFVRGAQAPQVPNAMLGGDGTILRIDEAVSLGLIPPRPTAAPGGAAVPGGVHGAAPSITPSVIAAPGLSFGPQAESILPSKSAVGMPITPLNTRISRVATEPKLSDKEEKELRHDMEVDAEYNTVYSKQQQRTENELRVRAAPGGLPWFLKPALDNTPGQPVSIVYPSQRRDANKNRVALGKSAQAVSERSSMLVPIRLEIEHEPYKLRDTFTWNAAEDERDLEIFAATLCDDFGLPPAVFVELIRDAVHSQVAEYVSEYALFPGGLNDGRGKLSPDALAEWDETRKKTLHHADVVAAPESCAAETTEIPEDDPEPEADEEHPTADLRIVIKLDILVGALCLVDQFEWDLLAGPDAAESFAAAFTADLGLAGEFTTAVAHSIREQVSAHVRTLFVLGYPLNGLELLDDEIRSSFLPHVGDHTTRTPHDISVFTPRLQQLASIDVARLEREHERDMRRKRRQTKGRRVIGLPDREPQRTFRTPPVRGLQGAADTISVRRGAAVDDVRENQAKRVHTDWYDLNFVFPGGLGLPAGATTTTHAYRPALNTAQTGGLGTAAPSMAFDIPAVPRGRPPKARQPLNTWDAALAKGVRREDLERQHPNIHNGRWYCGNCGCPDVLAPGRRKGPLGEKTLCGPCGKYFHQHRRMEVLEYSRDPEMHIQRLRRLGFPINEADAAAMLAPAPDQDDQFVPFGESDSEESDKSSSDEATPGAPIGVVQHTGVAEMRPSHPNLPTVGRGAPPTPSPPQWLQRALSVIRAKYPADRFWEIARPAEDGSGLLEWRIRCGDCPGKLYKLGPGDSLSNFEIHLKNRSHRAAVAARLGAAQ